MENYQFQLKEGENVKQHASFSKKVFLLRNFLMVGWIGILIVILGLALTIHSIANIGITNDRNKSEIQTLEWEKNRIIEKQELAFSTRNFINDSELRDIRKRNDDEKIAEIDKTINKVKYGSIGSIIGNILMSLFIVLFGLAITYYVNRLSIKQSKQSFLTVTNKRIIGNTKAFGIKTAIDMSLDKVNTCSLVKVGFWEALGINSGGLMYKFIGVESAFNIMSSINQSIEDYNQHKTTEQAQKIANEMSKNN